MGRSREYSRNEAGFKQTLRVKIDGVFIDRGFRNKGEAIEYLKRHEQLDKNDISRRVRFISN